jgi:uncharacterized protein with NAD-binding domain and iron-sulfur cluster
MRRALPKRVAILGGGAGALSAAFELTDRPGHEDRFEITVYQTGFRLGGKGASGRNLARQARIEEHGLHLWLGCYENAFRTMRRCYDELGRPPTAPLATWDRAFTPWPVAGVMERVGGDWLHWVGHFRRNDAVPGQGGAFLSPLDLVAQGIELLRGLFSTVPPTLGDQPASSLARSFRALARAARLPDEGDIGARLLGAALRAASAGLPSERLRLPSLVDAAREHLWRRVSARVERSTALRRLWITADLTATVIRGLVVDDVARHGFDALDRWDLVEWLLRHGASPLVASSGFVRGMYDFAFADHARRTPAETIAAGAMIRLMLRMMFNYRGSMFYRMEGGMGDVVFAPLYEVLRRRGVRFEFFHEVQRLGLSPDGRAVDAIEVDRQVRLRPGLAEYAPLIDIDGLPCWPSEPLFDQIERGAELAAGGHNLEAWGHGVPPAERRTLRRGRDFDEVVLGIALGALPPLCAELIDARPAWRAMFEHLPTVATQSMQLWLEEDPRALGWGGDPAVIDALAQPFNTYADMGHVLAHERWPSGGPRGLAYLCGPLPSADPAEVRGNAERWLTENAHVLWPRAGSPGRFDYGALHDPERRSGPARLETQYLRANVAPSDRYVRAPRGSTQYRLHPARSGFDNLYLAGDWTWTGMNLGNVEAAVTSGMLASRAIAGYPERVAWADDGIARAPGGARPQAPMDSQ